MRRTLQGVDGETCTISAEVLRRTPLSRPNSVYSMDCTVYSMQSLSFGELHLENDHLVIASGNRPSRFSTSWWAWTEFSNFSHSEFLQPKQITSPAESPESPVIFFSKISPTCQAASWSNSRTCLLLNLLIRLDSSSSRLFAFQTHEIQTNWLIRMSNRIRKSLKLCAILMPVMLTNAADWSVQLQLGSSRDSLSEFRCRNPDRAWSGC